MQKIIRALALAYACWVSDGATTQAASISIADGSHAQVISRPAGNTSLDEEVASAQ